MTLESEESRRFGEQPWRRVLKRGKMCVPSTPLCSEPSCEGRGAHSDTEVPETRLCPPKGEPLAMATREMPKASHHPPVPPPGLLGQEEPVDLAGKGCGEISPVPDLTSRPAGRQAGSAVGLAGAVRGALGSALRPLPDPGSGCAPPGPQRLSSEGPSAPCPTAPPAGRPEPTAERQLALPSRLAPPPAWLVSH